MNGKDAVDAVDAVESCDSIEDEQETSKKAREKSLASHNGGQKDTYSASQVKIPSQSELDHSKVTYFLYFSKSPKTMLNLCRLEYLDQFAYSL